MKLSYYVECIFNSHTDYIHYHFILSRLLKISVQTCISKADMEKNPNMQAGFITEFEGEIFQVASLKTKGE